MEVDQTKKRGRAESGRKIALITGITGQDGSYLTEFLISKDYIVHGIVRRSSSFNTGRVQHLYKDPKIHSEGIFSKAILKGSCA